MKKMRKIALMLMALLPIAACDDVDDKLTGNFSGYTIASGGTAGEQADGDARLSVESKSVIMTSPTWGTFSVENYDSEYLGNGTQGLSGLGQLTTNDGATYPATLICKVLYGASEATASLVISDLDAAKRLTFVQGDLPLIYRASGTYRGMANVKDADGNTWRAPVAVNVRVESTESTQTTISLSIDAISNGEHSLSSITVENIATTVKGNDTFDLAATTISTPRVTTESGRKDCYGTMQAFSLSTTEDVELRIDMFLDNAPHELTLFIKK